MPPDQPTLAHGPPGRGGKASAKGSRPGPLWGEGGLTRNAGILYAETGYPNRME